MGLVGFTKAFDMLVKKRPEKQRWSHPLLELRSTGPFGWPGEGGHEIEVVEGGFELFRENLS